MIKEVSFENSRGQKLAGILSIPDKEGKFPGLIRLHGFISNKEGSSKDIQERLSHEFVSLMIDYHGHGESEGNFEDFTVSGALDDAQTALNYLLDLDKVDPEKIVVMGSSLGGMLSLLLAARDSRVKLAVVCCPVVDFKEVFSKHQDIGLWREQGWVEALGVEGLKIKYNFFEDGCKFDVYSEAEKIECPVLVISGNKDTYIPVEHLEKLMQHLKNGRLEIVEGADHGFTENYEYLFNRMTGFIRENL